MPDNIRIIKMYTVYLFYRYVLSRELHTFQLKKNSKHREFFIHCLFFNKGNEN